MRPLTNLTLAEAVRALSARDRDLGTIVTRFGPPPLWAREPGFHTLVHIILEQQVSLASARAAYNRLIAAVSPLTPAGLMRLGDDELKRIGFSRQKTGYARELAHAILGGQLDLEALRRADDSEVRTELMKIKGIGRWTSDIYLLMVLRRPDIWPRGDLALLAAIKRVKRLRKQPTDAQADAMSEDWRPWRAVAARLLWHYYLSTR
jgi:DNA-3-methyladenine glycosylase II